MLDQKCLKPGGLFSPSWRLLRFGIVLVLCLASGLAFSQNPPATAPKAADIITYLTETITWNRGTVVEQQIANEPSDLRFLNDNRRISGQIVRLAFDFARLEEQNQSRQTTGTQSQEQTKGLSQHQRLSQAVANADLKVEQSQKELQSLRQKLEATSGGKRLTLESLIAETQSELAFRQALRDAMRNFLQFAIETSMEDTGAAGLRDQIEELARSVPAVLGSTNVASPEQKTAEQSPEGTSPFGNRQQPSGIWGLAADLLQLSHKRHTLDQQIESTDRLMQAGRKLRRPLVTNLRSLIQTGGQVGDRAPSSDPKALQQQKKELDALTAQFKDATAEMLPLGKQNILLNLYKRILTDWRDMVHNEYSSEMRSFLIRLGILVIIIAGVFVAGEAWRRAIFRYIRETRRRYQFLLFRKIMIWLALGVILALTFAAKLGSIATFAGLLTAGVAVALQNVILSVAGYFFLMGKYGIRVGDRVQIAGVTGEVVDIGLVRLHLLELSSGGTDAQPSGRVVAFSNSVVFQPTSGVFKKIPGTTFLWHEMTLTFSPESNYRIIQERVTTAVDLALEAHREEIERQMRHMERTLNSISAIELRPKIHIRSTASGIEVTVRFPVELENAVEIDDRVMREIYTAIEMEPKLKLVGSGMPTLLTDVSASTTA
jgi:small-conductance mechanosensitive channel